ncbi:hypothetical protein [Clostridium tertium]|uniref:Uncharacterized protein n=1 Tax=Clostridium tertium TaxID=1559 RepID=A0A9X3XQ61_9CLOT|nr:hypothetical protein [Clostridium tertium]MDB1940850.1 hypothetical protein [Clostridium tertium]MDC4242411.1 hypothetical protein [Clostridium tertium]
MKRNAVNIAGKNIYLDLYGDTVYYNFFDKNGYIVSKQIEQKFKIFYYRYSIIFIVMILLGDYFSSLLNTFLVGIGAIGIVELYFRFIFLKQLKVIKNFKRERKISMLENIIKSNEKEKVVMKACAYALLSVLIVINAIQQNFNILFLVLSILGAIYSLYIGIINVIAFSKIKKV